MLGRNVALGVALWRRIEDGAPAWAAALAFLLTLPSLGVGFVQDDLLTRVQVTHAEELPTPPREPWDLFRFNPTPGEVERLADIGFFPWWTAPELRLGFLRPIASITHYADYSLWPDAAWAMHLQNLLWYALAAFAVALVFRSLEGPGFVAAAAALMWAVDDAHGLPVGWIANRSALIAVTYGAFALWAHFRWREEGWRPGAALGTALFALGLLAAEAAIGALAFVIAHALWNDRGSWPARIGAVLPWLAVVAAWRVVYSAMGYGSEASGFYIDPVREPVEFLVALPGRMVFLLLGQLGFPPSEAMLMMPEHQVTWVALGGVAIIALVAIALWPLLRADRLARTWATGMVLACVPIVATWPNDRLLFFAGIGAFPLVARLLQLVRRERGAGVFARRSGAWRAVAWLTVASFVVLHVVLAPVLLPLRSMTVTYLMDDVQQRAASSLVDEPGEQTIVLRAPDWMSVTFGSLHQRWREGEPPGGPLILVTSLHEVEVHRTDERTLVVEATDGLMADPLSQVVRGAPFREGETLSVGPGQARVRSVDHEGRPTSIRFSFDRPLGEVAHTWQTWGGTELVPFELPAVGASRTLEPLDPTTVYFGE